MSVDKLTGCIIQSMDAPKVSAFFPLKWSKRILYLTLFLGLTGGLLALLGSEYFKRREPLRCDHALFDFGAVEIKGQREVEHTFVVKNHSRSPLTIDRIHSSCGCVATSSRKEVKAGETIEILAKMKIAQDQVQTRKVELIVESSSRTAKSYLTLSLSGAASPTLQTSPVELLAGFLAPGEEKMVDVELRVPASKQRNVATPVVNCFGSESIQIATVRAVDRNEENAMYHRFAVRLRVRAGRDAGSKREEIELSSEGESVRVPILWSVEDSVNIVPSTLHMGFLNVNESSGRRVTCKVVPKTAKIRDIQITGDRFFILRQVEKEGAWEIVIEFKGSTHSGTFAGKLSVTDEFGNSHSASITTIIL